MKITISLLCTFLFFSMSVGRDDSGSLPPGDTPPPTVFDLIEKAGSAADFDSAAFAIVLDSSLNRVNDQGVTYVDNYLLYKVLTDKGCRERSVLSWGYEPLTNQVSVREVRIIRGQEAISVPVDGIRDLPAPQSGIYWQDRIKILQLPRLYAGDGIEIKSVRKGYSYALLEHREEADDEKYIPPMPGQYFDIVLFEATAPIVRKVYVLQLPSNKRLHSRIYNGPMFSATSYNTDTTTYSWWVEDMPAWEPQPVRPDASDIVTKVVIATVENWEAKSRWFFEVNESQFEVTPGIKEKVDQILKEAGVAGGTEEEKAFELIHWVAQNIRYSGQTMGEGEGFTLHPGSMIFEQRSGVCKDIAGMLVTMMRAAGMDSYAAMTMAGSRIEAVPADQFNHCVVALKKDDGSFVMYDPTWVPYNKDIWSKYEAEQDYLIGTPDGEKLRRIQFSPPEESALTFKSIARILDNGTLEGEFEFEGSGVIDSRLRGLQHWYQLAEMENRLLNMLHQISDRVELIEYDRGDILDFHQNMWWKINYRIPEYALPVDDGLEFKSPMLQLVNNSRILFSAAPRDWADERRDDVFFYNTQLVDAREKIDLPQGYGVSEPPESEEIDETYAYYKGRSGLKGGDLIVTQTAKVKRRQIPPEGYAGFKKAMDEIKDFAKTVFRAGKEGKR